MIHDLIIVGGGMSGISVGHFFRDQNIRILERSEPAGEATGKNAGFVISGFGEHFQHTARRWGLERACEIQRIHLSNHRRIRDLAAGTSCEYAQTGSLALALDSREREELLESCRMMRQAGFQTEWVETPDAGLRETMGALWNQEDGRIDGKKFWTQLAGNLPVVRNCSATGVRHAGKSWIVETNQGEYQTERIVFCLNAFSSGLVPELQGRYIPLRGQMVELPLLASAPTNCPVYTQHGDLYWRFLDHSLIFGGLEDQVPEDETGIATEVSHPILEEQLRWIQEVFRPGLVGTNPVRAWCSTMAFTVDGFPFVGELPQKGLYILAGLCGLGHGYALECASWLYELIANRRNVIPTYFASDRIEDLPVYKGGPWRNLYEAWNY